MRPAGVPDARPRAPSGPGCGRRVPPPHPDTEHSYPRTLAVLARVLEPIAVSAVRRIQWAAAELKSQGITAFRHRLQRMAGVSDVVVNTHACVRIALEAAINRSLTLVSGIVHDAERHTMGETAAARATPKR